MAQEYIIPYWLIYKIILASYFRARSWPLIMNWLHSLEREAGFYTTRFGRSDPLMRVQELQARHHPDQQDEDDSNRLTQASDPDCGYKTVKKCSFMSRITDFFHHTQILQSQRIAEKARRMWRESLNFSFFCRVPFSWQEFSSFNKVDFFFGLRQDCWSVLSRVQDTVIRKNSIFLGFWWHNEN